MSIYVKTAKGAASLQTPQLRCMKLGTSQDTLERADEASTIIHSLTTTINDIPTGISYHNTGLPDPVRPNDFWIDISNSFIRRITANFVYPIPFANPKSWEDSICCHLQENGKTLVVITGTNSWSDYELVVTIKYTDTTIFRG